MTDPPAWNPAPVTVDGVPQDDHRAEKPLTAADVAALIPKEVG